MPSTCYIHYFYCQDFIVNIAVFNLVDSYLVQAKDFHNFLQNFEPVSVTVNLRAHPSQPLFFCFFLLCSMSAKNCYSTLYKLSKYAVGGKSKLLNAYKTSVKKLYFIKLKYY